MLQREHVPLLPLTTLRLGGPASRLVDVEREGDLVEAVDRARVAGEELVVLGGGSNVVVGDEGFGGTVLRVAVRGVDVAERASHAVVDVGAGEDWDAFVARAAGESWAGVECLSGIPGWAGATPIQNVGAYGQEVSGVLVSVRAYDRDARAFVTFAASDCALGYRASRFKRNPRWIVTRVRLSLRVAAESEPIRYAELARALSVAEGKRAPLGVVRETVLSLRRGKGMVLDPRDPDSVSAGSFFVNPVIDAARVDAWEAELGVRPPSFPAGPGRAKVAAAWLVERAGFPKGWGEGRAGVSTKHALALVNRGGATARELLAVARAIRDGVRDRFGVDLEPEPVFVGCAW
jgi:UDP-N-acetylmuramate dehydrogenase